MGAFDKVAAIGLQRGNRRLLHMIGGAALVVSGVLTLALSPQLWAGAALALSGAAWCLRTLRQG